MMSGGEMLDKGDRLSVRHGPCRADAVRIALVMAALLFFWDCNQLYSFPVSAVETRETFAAFSGSEALKTAYAAGEALGLVLSVFLVAARRPFAGRPGAMAAAGAAGLAAGWAMLALVGSGGFPDGAALVPALAALSLVFGLVAALYLVRVFGLVVREGALRATVLLAGSFILYGAADWLLVFAGASYPAITLGFMAASVAAVWLLGVQGSRGASAPGRAAAPVVVAAARQPDAAAPAWRRAFGDAARLPVVPLLLMWVLACFGSSAASALIGMPIGPLRLFSESGTVGCAVQSAAALVLASVALLAVRKGRARQAPAALFLVSLAVFCAVLLVVYLDHGVRYLAIASDHAALCALWVAAAQAVCERRLDPSACAAAVALPVVLAQCLAVSDYVFNVGLFHELAEAASAGTVLVVAALAAVAAGASFAVWRLLGKAPGPDDLASGAAASLVEAAVRGRGLTEREEEVAVRLYRGLSAPRVAEELGVSEATVKTHATHIYRKLGVRSKQDLIAYVDSFR